jgi:hypothetical protein
MPTNDHDGTDAPPPHAQLIQMATAYWASRLLYVATRLGIADLLADGAKTAESLAESTRTHPRSLYRVMRTLASLGLMTESAGHRFALTPLGAALVSGAPGAARATILTLGGDWAWHGFENLQYSVETGKSGVEKALGEPIFDWLGKHPEDASLFTQTMIGFHGAEGEAIAEAYDFSARRTIVDVGGASGHLLTTLLGKYPGPRGILFDLSRSNPGASSRPFPPEATRTCSRTSSTIGRRSSASRSSAIAARPWERTPGCSSSRWSYRRGTARIRGRCST